MKHILISIKPQFVAKILNGEKTLEVRKSMPKCELPCKVYIYCTKSQKKLLAIFKKGDLIWSDDKDEQRFDETIFVKDDYFGVADDRNAWLGKVVSNFTLNVVEEFEVCSDDFRWLVENTKCCLTMNEVLDYCKGQDLYGWYIDDLKIYDKPKDLSEFGLKKAPQSWQYIKETE